MRRWFAIAAVLLINLVCVTPSNAFWQSRDSNYDKNIVSGGAAPSYAAGDEQINEGCAFATTCSVTATVTAGFVVVSASGNTSGVVITGVSVCSTPLAQVVTTGVFGTNYTGDIWAGTIACSGSQTITVTVGSSALFKIEIGVGTLSNLTSNTATSTCTGFSASISGGAIPCSGTITVPSSGFGICGGFQSTNSAITFVSPVTTDKSAVGATTAGAFGSDAAASTFTPSMNGSNFFQGSLACVTYH